MTKARLERGRRGEDAACEYLRRLGYEILVRNWRSRQGELDVVALDGEVIVIVEVKLRSRGFDPLEAVDGRKQRQLARVALVFLAACGLQNESVRFDVVGVDGQTMTCEHVTDAFDCPLDC